MSFDEFAEDAKTIDAVIRNFNVLGEAAGNVPESVAGNHLNIPWRPMIDMRNFAVHEYWGVELSIVWKTIKDDLPPLVPALKELLSTSI